MKIWIVTPGEPAVFHPDAAHQKPMRSAILARTLARRGHEVIFWTGAFQHQTKSWLGPVDRLLDTEEPNLKLWLIDSKGYRKNISFARMRDYAQLSRRWSEAAARFPAPDLILSSWPPVDLAAQCVRMAQATGAKALIDIRDLWPDIIYDRLRIIFRLRSFPRLLLHYNRAARQALSQADGLIGVSDGFVEWGLDYAERGRRASDKAFYLSTESLGEVPPEARKDVDRYWDDRGIGTDTRKVIISWVGTLPDVPATRRSIDRFAALPPTLASRVQLVCCGTGSLQAYIERCGKAHDHISYGGFIPRDIYAGLLERTSYGLFNYEPTFDFLKTIPNKINEYLSGGAHVLTTLDGEARQILDPRGVAQLLNTATQEAFDRQIGQLVEAGPLTEDARATARRVYRELFDANMIYNQMADHVEEVGRSG